MNLADRRSRLLTDNVDLLRNAFRYARGRQPFTIEAIVVLPDHLHTMWTLPWGDADFPTRWRLIKTVFSRGIAHGERRSQSRLSKDERGVWQRRYWEHTLRDERDFERHCDYIHFNPIKHGHVQATRDWPYSSFHRWVKLGVYTADWTCEEEFNGGEFGET